MGILQRRLTATVVVLGVVAFIGMTLLNTTAYQIIRGYSYRLFFIIHLMVAMIVPPLIIFHAKSARIFMAEAFLVFIADLVSRKIGTVTSQATLESIPGTDLIKISAPVPFSKIHRFVEHPGSHIYLNIPAAARPSSNPASSSFLLFEFLYNPFTVANVDEEGSELTLVARHRSGLMTTTLAKLAAIRKPGGRGENQAAYDESKIPLSIEGPYGVAKHFPQLTNGDYDRILLVAGGVGATFTVPLYRALVRDSPNVKVEMVWAVRGAGDATWALTEGEAKSLMNDENVHIFLTGNILEAGDGLADSGPGDGGAAGGGVELSALHRDRRRGRYTSEHNRRRPNLQKIVDDCFRHGAEERIAVLVCGPTPMTRELRSHVETWVMKGRRVWWHSENFDW